MKLKEFYHMLMISATVGVDKALAKDGGLSADITKAEAYRLYGRCEVDRWIAEGLILPAKVDGKASKKLLDRITLERIARNSNRITYLPVADRKR